MTILLATPVEARVPDRIDAAEAAIELISHAREC